MLVHEVGDLLVWKLVNDTTILGIIVQIGVSAHSADRLSYWVLWSDESRVYEYDKASIDFLKNKFKETISTV